MKMEDKRIIELAREHDLDMGIYYPPTLKDLGDNTMKFVSSTTLTSYGEKLIAFARACSLENLQ